MREQCYFVARANEQILCAVIAWPMRSSFQLHLAAQRYFHPKSNTSAVRRSQVLMTALKAKFSTLKEPSRQSCDPGRESFLMLVLYHRFFLRSLPAIRIRSSAQVLQSLSLPSQRYIRSFVRIRRPESFCTKVSGMRIIFASRTKGLVSSTSFHTHTNATKVFQPLSLTICVFSILIDLL